MDPDGAKTARVCRRRFDCFHLLSCCRLSFNAATDANHNKIVLVFRNKSLSQLSRELRPSIMITRNCCLTVEQYRSVAVGGTASDAAVGSLRLSYC